MSPEGAVQRTPLLIAGENLAIVLAIEIRSCRLAQRPSDLLLARPQVAQEHGASFPIAAERLALQIDGDPSGERERHDERRRHQIIGAHLRMDAAFEVPVSGQRRGDDEVPAPDLLGDLGREGPGIADAGGAAVADQVEAELIEIGREPGALVVGGHDP